MSIPPYLHPNHETQAIAHVFQTLQVTDAAVRVFVEERPGMTFVGLLATDAGFSDFLSGEGNLKVGTATQRLTSEQSGGVQFC